MLSNYPCHGLRLVYNKTVPIDDFMILLSFAILALIVLIVAVFLKSQHKMIVLAACVITLVVVNLLNEVQAALEAQTPRMAPLGRGETASMDRMGEVEWTAMSQEEVEATSRELLQEQREILGYLTRRWEEGEHVVVSFGDMHSARLRMILSLLKQHSTQHEPSVKQALYSVDLQHQFCDRHCFARTFPLTAPPEAYPILLVSNPSTSRHLNTLKQAYLSLNITLILLNAASTPLRYHSLSALTHHHPFSNNYLPKLLQQHPQATLEHCSQYRTFDYDFYLASQKQSLPELCSQALPSSPTATCVRKHIKQEGGKVPQGWVRDCLNDGDAGLVRDNGWVGVKKEYYWSGRVNRTGYDGVTQSSDL